MFLVLFLMKRKKTLITNITKCDPIKTDGDIFNLTCTYSMKENLPKRLIRSQKKVTILIKRKKIN